MKRNLFAATIVVAFVAASSTDVLAAGNMNGTEWLNMIQKWRATQQGQAYPTFFDDARPAESPWVRATVQRISPRAGLATVWHGTIKSIGMPAMIMTFPVADPGHLRQLKPGSRIEFRAAEVAGIVKITDVRMRP